MVFANSGSGSGFGGGGATGGSGSVAGSAAVANTRSGPVVTPASFSATTR